MIVGAIQARMGSTRLPGKVLAPILGEPMVWRIYERVRGSQYLDKVVIATTTQASDDELVSFAKQRGIDYYRGSVDDIVGRLYGVAQYFDADILVRIWGDCPFVDAEVIDRVIEKLVVENLDYVSNTLQVERAFPAGLDVEAYRRDTLELIRDKTQDGFYHEFPFEYVFGHPNSIRFGIIHNDEDLSHIHLTVDYPQDLKLARAIYASLYQLDKSFSFRDALAVLQELPNDVASANAHLPRNPDYLRKKGEHQ